MQYRTVRSCDNKRITWPRAEVWTAGRVAVVDGVNRARR
jgi:hypothetical protein